MDIEQARAAMRTYIAALNTTADEPVRETGYKERVEGGWVFYWNSVAYLETGDFGSQPVGQGPVIVCDDGAILQGGSAERPADVLGRFGRRAKS